MPSAGAKVQVRSGHSVTYDTASDQVIRSIHIAGTLRFDPDRDTRLEIGLIKTQAGDDASENGFDCDAHQAQSNPDDPRPALEVGTWAHPIAAGHTALIRLVAVSGMNPETCPAIVCCGGRMDLHGAPHRVDHAAELDNAAVASALDDAAMMDGDRRIDEIATETPQARQGAILVRRGESAVADNVGDQDCSKLARFPHGAPSVRHSE